MSLEEMTKKGREERICKAMPVLRKAFEDVNYAGLSLSEFRIAIYQIWKTLGIVGDSFLTITDASEVVHKVFEFKNEQRKEASDDKKEGCEENIDCSTIRQCEG